MIIRLDPHSPTAPYAQIRDQVAAMVISGVLPAGTRLPAIRQLANDLDLAVNTVGRAYQELEAEGLVAGQGRKGTVVRAPAPVAVEAGARRVEASALGFALEALHWGVDVERAVDLVRRAFAGVERPEPA